MMMKRTMNQLTSTPIRIPKTRASCMDPPPNTTLDGGRPHQPRALCGLFVSRDQMAGLLEAVSYALPLTYAFDALDRVASGSDSGGRGWLDAAVIAAVTLLALALGAATLRRRTP